MLDGKDLAKYKLDPKKLSDDQRHMVIQPEVPVTPGSTGLTPVLSHLTLAGGRSYASAASTGPSRRAAPPPPPVASADPTPHEAATRAAPANRNRPHRLATQTTEVQIRPARNRGDKKQAPPKSS